ncbi:MAG TPA: hypothetical protein VM580_26895 [Labilithrix sp.]|jgi:hypothetical protein|nr:hypothetical protein [Labilithrix sp.]
MMLRTTGARIANAPRLRVGVFRTVAMVGTFTFLMALSSDVAAGPIFGLSVAIARAENGVDPVVDDAWMERQIDEANRLFGPIGTRFRWTIEKPLAEPHGALHTRTDRDALTNLGEKAVIDVFVVRELEDVDEPGRFRMGVCWTGLGGRRFIVVSRTAAPRVLAHELGHFFGNPHSPVMNNLMSYSRDGSPVFLDARQSSTIENMTTRFLDTGRLVDVGPPRRFR